ncbi:hypothetical protein T11_4285 [Trichinella zimbabwensis]|uniref:Uncharacterized protein n=1 Tax=Trichinella zimbabwensis TaxID=268475 RepID=A0A0V1GVH6_9BILA|nr:hypothetical protein T11_4285 [Trichinella zimbabwensis]
MVNLKRPIIKYNLINFLLLRVALIALIAQRWWPSHQRQALEDCGGIHPFQRRVKDVHLWPGSDAATAEKQERTGARRGCEELSRPWNPGYELFRPARQGDRLSSSGDDHDGQLEGRDRERVSHS